MVSNRPLADKSGKEVLHSPRSERSDFYNRRAEMYDACLEAAALFS